MNLGRLIWREILHRKLSFGLSVATVAAAVGCLIAVAAQLGAHDLSTSETLESMNAEYEWIEVDPDFADTAAFCEKYGFPMDHSGNTIIVAGKTDPRRYAACVVSASTKLDVNHAVRRLIGTRRVSFASAEETQALTGMAIGGVTALGLPSDIPLYFDSGLKELEYVVLGSGTRQAKLKVRPGELRKIPNGFFVDGLAIQQAG